MTNPANIQPNIAITPEQWRIVSAILQKHVPENEVWAFGSRATHTEKSYSDLDLAIIGNTSLTLSLLAAIEHDFSESDLPFKVDVIDWATISPAFRRIIENHKVVVQF
ncbi:nucleotidyltransferase family protein [Undibacterium oligocarboniphilum]|uniref:Nucleotidyltransferase domain-containing protein n=1 Tax=Undibacterium oligocarboniphilum TaxID=666702 RepID=A0A850QKD5_9BURK|nr:nucleotidyltransferase domain-containing protein [Undibacterium oligocarboniphilum]MBC3869464.1 nucleotidyltransferase domain-containing protein [Undibacterium oligocarboniphilum]NVO77843.1 nucleotidyltransferase domain-containing protein [Undibacterium oligocarboniphilum]